MAPACGPAGRERWGQLAEHWRYSSSESPRAPDLRGADFRGADLRGVDFSGVPLDGNDFDFGFGVGFALGRAAGEASLAACTASLAACTASLAAGGRRFSLRRCGRVRGRPPRTSEGRSSLISGAMIAHVAGTR